jgi:hypothetical protein
LGIGEVNLEKSAVHYDVYAVREKERLVL